MGDEIEIDLSYFITYIIYRDASIVKISLEIIESQSQLVPTSQASKSHAWGFGELVVNARGDLVGLKRFNDVSSSY